MGTIFLSPCLKGNFRQVFFLSLPIILLLQRTTAQYIYTLLFASSFAAVVVAKARENKDATHATLSLGSGRTRD